MTTPGIFISTCELPHNIDFPKFPQFPKDRMQSRTIEKVHKYVPQTLNPILGVHCLIARLRTPLSHSTVSDVVGRYQLSPPVLRIVLLYCTMYSGFSFGSAL